MQNMLPKTEVKELPSQFKAYPKGASISYRTYPFGEVRIINESRMSFMDEAKFVLKGIDTSFDKLDLTMGDFLYLSFLRKISTVDTPTKVLETSCKKCGTKLKPRVKEDELDFFDMEAEQLPIRTTISDLELVIYPLTIRGYFNILENDLHKNGAGCLAIQCMNNIYDPETEGHKELYNHIYNIIYNAVGEDGELLELIDKELNHSLKPLEVKCTNKDCKHTNYLDIDTGGKGYVVRPFRKSGGNLKSRIHYGEASKD